MEYIGNVMVAICGGGKEIGSSVIVYVFVIVVIYVVFRYVLCYSLIYVVNLD